MRALAGSEICSEVCTGSGRVICRVKEIGNRDHSSILSELGEVGDETSWTINNFMERILKGSVKKTV